MIALAVLLQLLDAASFALASTVMPVAQVEQNPIIAALYANGGLLAFFAYKLVLVLVIVALLGVMRPRARAIGSFLFVLAGAIGAAANTIALYTVLNG